jgi:hypothetical protein
MNWSRVLGTRLSYEKPTRTRTVSDVLLMLVVDALVLLKTLYVLTLNRLINI